MQRYMKGMSNGGVIYARNDEPLTDEALRASVPSIFAEEAHESRSERFAPIPTSKVITGLRNEGFEPFMAQQSRTRVEGKQEFTKHMVRMRHRELQNAAGEAFEIILVNANDGTSAYNMIPGFFRFVCANGLFVGDKFDDVKVRHSGDAVSQVIEGAYTVLDEAPRVVDAVRRMQGTTLSDGEALVLGRAAHRIRYPEHYLPVDDDERRLAPVGIDQLMRARRYDDAPLTLWNVFNRAQENIMKGGLNYITPRRHDPETGRVIPSRRMTTRPVTGIDQTKSLNRALWAMAEEFHALKEQAA